MKSKDIMAEHLIIKGETKEELYATLLPQLKSLVEGESDIIANMANISACIMDTFHFWWVGFYRVIDGTLVLGPFRGPLACTRIKRGKGVCGTAWNKAETIVVEDVEKFPGHIACSSASRSEIVVPVIGNGEVIAILDIDSEHLSTFDDIDKNWLGKVAELFTDSLIFISLLLDHTRTIDEFGLRGISVHITICSAQITHRNTDVAVHGSVLI